MKNVYENVKKLPRNPGVYIMYDRTGEVIYVGKAKSLIDRVSSYFNSHNTSSKTALLVSLIDHIEYIVTDTEVEALVLESNLIKKYMPRFNVMLKDDKHYPYIKVTVNDRYPSIQVVRKKFDDGAKYFGPFPQSSIIKPSLKFITKHFPIRVCTGAVNEKKKCLNYHIRRCLGPCVDDISEEDYRQFTGEVVLFLQGKHERLKLEIEKKMKEFSQNQQYEQAAIYRDRLHSLQKITQKQKMILDANDNIDVLVYEQESGIVYVCIMVFREGFLIHQYNYSLDIGDEDNIDEVLTQGVLQHYSEVDEFPQEILMQESLKISGNLGESLKVFLKNKVAIKYPHMGQKYDLINLAAQNVIKFIGNRNILTPKARRELEKLKEELALDSLPVSILGFDISHLSGTNTVASAVYFENGKPKKSNYKRYLLKTVGSKPDDYRSMFEVISRYFGKQPSADIILIDGGKGQLGSALQAFVETGKSYKVLISLAKKEEEIFLPGRETSIKLAKNSPALHVLQRVRDEAHRFAITYQKQRHTKNTFRSALEEIPGVSKDRRQKLLFYFGSLEAVKKASLDDIINIPGFGHSLAQKIYDVFH